MNFWTSTYSWKNRYLWVFSPLAFQAQKGLLSLLASVCLSVCLSVRPSGTLGTSASWMQWLKWKKNTIRRAVRCFFFTKFFIVFPKSSFELRNFSWYCSSLFMRGRVFKMLRLRQLWVDFDVLWLKWKRNTIRKAGRWLFSKLIFVFPKSSFELGNFSRSCSSLYTGEGFQNAKASSIWHGFCCFMVQREEEHHTQCCTSAFSDICFRFPKSTLN
jgi:hypothetical protein